MAKKNFKNLAISLRQSGLSYSDILKKVPVAKSTLSLWLRSVGLSKRQRQILTERKLQAIRRGGARKKEQRSQRIEEINSQAVKDVGTVSERDLWLAGIMLYWAEGNKQKDTNVSVGVRFSNSDPKMMRVFLLWLRNCLQVDEVDLAFEIYIHESCKDFRNDFVDYWSKVTSVSRLRLNKVYYKKSVIKSNRKNQGENYHGQLSVGVRRSTELNRKISGWINGFCQNSIVVNNASSSNGRTTGFEPVY